MNIAEAKEEIKRTIEIYLEKDRNGNYVIPRVKQRPLFLIGPPGVGKTQIMEQVAQECSIGLVSYTITHHTRQSAVGLPFINTRKFDGIDYSVTEYTMSEIIAGVYENMKETGNREGILFLDEINCVSETLIPTMLKFLQYKTFGNMEIPEGWIIITAGNPPEYNKSVREFDMVTLDRVRRIDVEANYDVWKKYASQNEVNNAILGYLELKPKNFYRVENSVDGMQYATARGWEDLGAVIDAYERKGYDVGLDTIGEYIRQKEIAEDFHAYLELFYKYRENYDYEGILAGRDVADSYQKINAADFAERISVIYLLLSALEKGITKVLEDRAYLDKRFEFLKGKFAKEEDRGIPANKLDETLKREFNTEAQRIDEDERAVLLKIEHALEFVENIDEADTAMAVMITELSLRRNTASFLAQNTSAKYIELARQYLEGDKKKDIVARL